MSRLSELSRKPGEIARYVILIRNVVVDIGKTGHYISDGCVGLLSQSPAGNLESVSNKDLNGRNHVE
ncbi:MAG: hypothetical protein AB7G93_08585 [Bdellovibrionales bacterium]